MTSLTPPADSAPFNNTDERSVVQKPLPSRPRLHAVVSVRKALSPGRIRLTFSGADVAAFIRTEAAQAPGTWIKLFVPCTNGGSVGRAYTLRQYDLGKGTFDVDFVMHETGPLSSWAQASQAGDAVEFAGPRDGGFTLRPGSHWVVLIGDETALPAIQAILASVPIELPGLVLIETDHPGEHEAFFVGPNIMLSWVKRTQDRSGAAYPLVEALERQVILHGPGQAWVAGESGSVMALRTMLNEKWKLEKTDISAKGYWKSGVAHFRS